MIGKTLTRLNDSFAAAMTAATKEHLHLDTRTTWDFLADSFVTERVDGTPFEPLEHMFVLAFSAGYAAALKIAASE